MASPLVVPRKVEGDEEAAAEGHVTGWWSHVRWIVGLMLLPCRPIVSFASVPRTSGGGGGGGVSAVTGTLLFPLSKRDKVGLILQEGGPAGPTLAVLDLPVPAGATDFFGLGRLILECDRARAGEGPLLSAPSWAVHCEGRRVGFAGRRAAPTEAEEWALQATLAVSAGAGSYRGPTREVGRAADLRTFADGSTGWWARRIQRPSTSCSPRAGSATTSASFSYASNLRPSPMGTLFFFITF